MAEYKMAEFKMAAIIKLSQNEWVSFFFESVWIKCWFFLWIQMAESKMAEFKIIAII